MQNWNQLRENTTGRTIKDYSTKRLTMEYIQRRIQARINQINKLLGTKSKIHLRTMKRIDKKRGQSNYDIRNKHPVI